MSSEPSRQEILSYLAAHSTMTLATDQGGNPWAAALFYASDGLTLYFLSELGTRHANNLLSNPRVAVTIQEDHHSWMTIQGLQLEGTCTPVEGPVETARAMAIYGAKFAFLKDLLTAPRELGAAVARARFYKIVPTWLRLTDNTRGFGWKQAIRLEDTEPGPATPQTNP